MDPTQQAASQIIKGGTVTALTVSTEPHPITTLLICHAMLRDISLSRLFSVRVVNFSNTKKQ